MCAAMKLLVLLLVSMVLPSFAIEYAVNDMNRGSASLKKPNAVSPSYRSLSGLIKCPREANADVAMYSCQSSVSTRAVSIKSTSQLIEIIEIITKER